MYIHTCIYIHVCIYIYIYIYIHTYVHTHRKEMRTQKAEKLRLLGFFDPLPCLSTFETPLHNMLQRDMQTASAGMQASSHDMMLASSLYMHSFHASHDDSFPGLLVSKGVRGLGGGGVGEDDFGSEASVCGIDHRDRALQMEQQALTPHHTSVQITSVQPPSVEWQNDMSHSFVRDPDAPPRPSGMGRGESSPLSTQTSSHSDSVANTGVDCEQGGGELCDVSNTSGISHHSSTSAASLEHLLQAGLT